MNEIMDLKKENENLGQIKNQYKEYYEKMRKGQPLQYFLTIIRIDKT